MEISTFFGLPAHPLIVHSVVVLVPLVALGAIAVVARGGWRWRIGWLVAAGAVLNVILTPLATGSGEALEERVDGSAALEEHTELGAMLLPWVAVLAVALVAFMVIDRLRSRAQSAPTASVAASTPAAGGTALATKPVATRPVATRPATRSWLLARPVALVLSAIIVLSAVGSIAMVVLIGHNGAKATWSDVGASQGS